MGWSKEARSRHYEQNKDVINARRREYYRKNRETILIQTKTYRDRNRDLINSLERGYINRLKTQLMEILGGAKCVKCGFTDFRALQFDHISGDGPTERKRVKGDYSSRCRYYIQHPDEAERVFQVLCANCNWIKRYEEKEYLKIRA